MPKRCFRICAAETSIENCGLDHHSPNEFVRSQVSLKVSIALCNKIYRPLPTSRFFGTENNTFL